MQHLLRECDFLQAYFVPSPAAPAWDLNRDNFENIRKVSSSSGVSIVALRIPCTETQRIRGARLRLNEPTIRKASSTAPRPSRTNKIVQCGESSNKSKLRWIKSHTELAVIMPECGRGTVGLPPSTPFPARRAPPVRSPVQPPFREPESRRRR